MFFLIWKKNIKCVFSNTACPHVHGICKNTATKHVCSTHKKTKTKMNFKTKTSLSDRALIHFVWMSVLCVCTCVIRVSNAVFAETEKNLVTRSFFQNRKTGFLAAWKPGFSVLNFDLQMSNYATILTQTAYNVHDTMFLFVYPTLHAPGVQPHSQTVRNNSRTQ